jgi:5-methylcytosine-specific restriction endonuclease McrA
MAANTNKRIPVKWVRDRAKAAYDKKDSCYICNATEELELHHTHSITLLLNAWASKKQYDISTDEGILAVRDEFIAEHHAEIYEGVFTLCNKHHVNLHSIYGKAPALASAPKQERWIEAQKNKNGDEPTTKVKQLSSFGSFY